MIPQPDSVFKFDKLHNIVSGEFGKVGQTDWVVVCSRNGRSEILVIWGGQEHCHSVVEEEYPDSAQTQGWGSHGMVYSRIISSFPAPVERLFKMDEGLPEKRTHDAINDYFMDKGGSSVYCHEGKWVRFGTAD